jgi:hypothetical protein
MGGASKIVTPGGGAAVVTSTGELVSITGSREAIVEAMTRAGILAASAGGGGGSTNGTSEGGSAGGRVPQRNKPRIEQGNLNEGWEHIDSRHITGNHPDGPGDLFAPGTTRKQIEQAANTVVRRGRRVTEDPSRTVQTFEKDIIVNGKKDLVRVVVDSNDGNRVITIFPVRGGH